LHRRAFKRAERAGSPADAALINVGDPRRRSITGDLMTKRGDGYRISNATLLMRAHLH
jgi:hypothetical protein